MFVVLLLLVFSLPLSLAFVFTEEGGTVVVRVFGFKAYTFTVGGKNKKIQKEEKPAKQHEKVSFSERFDALKLILKIVSRILKHLRLLPKIKKLVFRFNFGLSDAAKTGMASGAVYGLVYGIQARLHGSKRVSIEEVSVVSDFQTPCFSVYCSGIITTCLAHIMGIAAAALAVVLKQNFKEE